MNIGVAHEHEHEPNKLNNDHKSNARMHEKRKHTQKTRTLEQAEKTNAKEKDKLHSPVSNENDPLHHIYI